MINNPTTTYGSMKYDDNIGERIVMLFGVNIAKKPTKVYVTPKDSSSMENNINHFPHYNMENEKMKTEFEHHSENENDNDNDDNEYPNMDVGQRTNHEKIKKVIPWTQDEHRAFLEGLKEFGKGRWKQISKNYVMTRTYTQVASHAQKYFQRCESDPMFRNKRQSIFDMKLDDECENSRASGGSSSLGPSSRSNSH